MLDFFRYTKKITDRETMGKNLSKTVNIESESNVGLFSAVERGHVHNLHNLYRSLESTQLHTARKKGKALLHYAVLNGQRECVKYLLDAGLDPNTKDDYGESPLLEVAHCNRWIDTKVIENMIKMLIQAKGDIDIRSFIGRTCLLKCIVAYRLATAEKLLNLGANPNICDSDGLYPIHVCATYKLLLLLRKLVAHKADINSQDVKGRTALYLSINAGHLEIPTELVKFGCNVNLGSSFGYPLSAAITKCRPEMVELLLKSGVFVQQNLNEQRQVFLKGSDYLNLALIVLHIHSAIADLTHYTEEPRIGNLFATINILDLITQALGSKANFNKNIFFRSRKPDLSNDPALSPMQKKLNSVYKKLVFVHAMSFGTTTLEGLPKLSPNVDRTSLQNICRMKVRQYILSGGTNIIYGVNKLDCPVTVKDMLLLKDIGWS